MPQNALRMICGWLPCHGVENLCFEVAFEIQTAVDISCRLHTAEIPEMGLGLRRSFIQ